MMIFLVPKIEFPILRRMSRLLIHRQFLNKYYFLQQYCDDMKQLRVKSKNVECRQHKEADQDTSNLRVPSENNVHQKQTDVQVLSHSMLELLAILLMMK